MFKIPWVPLMDMSQPMPLSLTRSPRSWSFLRGCILDNDISVSKPQSVPHPSNIIPDFDFEEPKYPSFTRQGSWLITP